MPAISVIVPVYKVEPYLRRCVDSILAQTFTDFELILVDDGSPDNCPAICDEYAAKDSRVHVIHQTNGGLSAARNAGIDWAFANSDSQWLSFIDSDDWVHPKMLEAFVTAAMANDTDLVMCRCERTTGSVEPTDNIPQAEQMLPEDAWITEPLPMVACAKLYRRNLFETLRFPGGKLHEDEYITYKIVFACPLVSTIQAPLYYYFQHANSIINSNWSPKRLDAIQAVEEQCCFFKRNNYKLAYYETCRMCMHKITGDYHEAKKHPDVSSNTIRKLQKKARKAFFRYRKLETIPFRGNEWIYDAAFPALMSTYWKAIALANKIKSLWRR